MNETTPQVLRSQPGVKRDGTRFEGDYYTDALWNRFQRGLPRKIGGYRSIVKTLSEVSRGFGVFPEGGLAYCHSGGPELLERFTIDSNKNSSVVVPRTPAALVDDLRNRWMFDYQGDSSSLDDFIIAHVAPNGEFIENAEGGQVFYGDATGTALLTPITLPVNANASGGIVSLHPYLFYYGNGGIIGHSVPGNPADMSGAGSNISRPWGKKIVKGMPLRSGGSGPSGIFWALDAIIRASFSGGATAFQYDTVATGTSIMSPDSVVDYDGVFYWAGVDRFLRFNGVVQEVPNVFNVNWFFDGLNQTQRARVFAFKVPRFGEIWWCYPRGEATECTHAVIYNVRENYWYDTLLPADMRAAGQYNNGFAAPILAGATLAPVDSGGGPAVGSKVWVHEQGVDLIDGQRILPIEAYFETADMSFLTKGINASMRVVTIEPDFVQSGDMTVQATGRANARAPETPGQIKTFPATAAPNQPQEQVVQFKEERRELRLKFTSNTPGGDYQMGQCIAHTGEGDKREVA